MNNYNIRTEPISSDEFFRCCQEGYRQSKLAYLAIDQPYGNEPFEHALKKVIKDDIDFVRAEIVADNCQQMRDLLNVYIQATSFKVCYGIAEIGPIKEITMFMAY